MEEVDLLVLGSSFVDDFLSGSFVTSRHDDSSASAGHVLHHLGTQPSVAARHDDDFTVELLVSELLPPPPPLPAVPLPHEVDTQGDSAHSHQGVRYHPKSFKVLYSSSVAW